MKKIVFILQGIYNGGTEVALYNLISNLDNNLYKIYVSYVDHLNSEKMMLEKIGPFVTYINLEETSLEADAAIYTTSIDNDDIYDVIKHNLTIKHNYFWFHYFCDEQTVFMKKYSNDFDKIIAVSQYCKNKLSTWNFINKDKICVIHNYINDMEIKEKSNVNVNIELSNTLNLITVARFAPIKRYDRVKRLCEALSKRKIDYKYIIIGNNNIYESEYGQLVIDMFKDNKNVIMLGAKENPYPYIKACDYSVILSNRETWSLVMSESKILGVPCVCSNFESATEQITDSINGIIISDDSDFAYETRINDIIEKKCELKNNLKSFVYDNSEIMHAWNNLLK